MRSLRWSSNFIVDDNVVDFGGGMTREDAFNAVREVRSEGDGDEDAAVADFCDEVLDVVGGDVQFLKRGAVALAGIFAAGARIERIDCVAGDAGGEEVLDDALGLLLMVKKSDKGRGIGAVRVFHAGLLAVGSVHPARHDCLSFWSK